MNAYYNDNNRHVCAWLKALMDENLIMCGDIDDRPIEEVQPYDVREYVRCHFFAGIGGWDLALQLCGWPADEPVWTVSCPCPPFSTAAGKRRFCPECENENFVWHVGRTGFAVCADCQHEWFEDSRHLWPEAWRLIAERRPPTIFGEQVSSQSGYEWFTGVRASLEIAGYEVGSADMPGTFVGAPHIRQRLFFVGNTIDRKRKQTNQRDSLLSESAGSMVDPHGPGCEGHSDGKRASERISGQRSLWTETIPYLCSDGKERPIEPGILPLADGIPERVGRIRGYGNSIIPQVAATFIKTYMETR